MSFPINMIGKRKRRGAEISCYKAYEAHF